MMEELKKKYRVLFGSGSTNGNGSSEDGDFDYGDDDTLPW